MSNRVYQDWLNLLCQMLPNVRAGVFLPVGEEGETPESSLTWPAASGPDPDLLAATDMAFKGQASVATSRQDAGGEQESLIMACPLRWQEQDLGVIGVRAAVPATQQNSVTQLLQWGGAWLYLLQSGTGPTGSSPAVGGLEEFLPLLECPDAEVAVITAAGLLARKLECERVTVALAQGSNVEFLGLSNRATFDERTALGVQIRSAVEESLAHDGELGPGGGEDINGVLPPAHAELARSSGHYLFSCPLRSDGRVVGSVVLEQAQAPGPESLEACLQLAPWLGALLEIKRAQAAVVAPVSHRISDLFSGPGKRVAYSVAAGIVALLLVAAGSTSDKVVADASLEGAIQRAIVSPFDGYVASSLHRAGEEVEEGDLLASLKDDDLKLERQKWRSQSAELQREYRKALASLDHSQARIFQSQVEQAQAELDLLDYQLERVELRAPFDGVIIEGDLNQQLGVPVDRGQMLFQVAPLNQYRVVLQVDQRDIPRIHPGQEGALTLSALPGTGLRFRVSQVSGVAAPANGLSLFRVEAELLETAALESLRPGMQGIGKVEVGDTRRLVGWSRRLWGWLQLQAWRWMP